MLNPILMRCGCRAMGLDSKTNRQICLTHLCEDKADDRDVDLLNSRMASCMYCKKETPSNLSLAFFSLEKEKEKDRYYCGCKGWD